MSGSGNEDSAAGAAASIPAVRVDFVSPPPIFAKKRRALPAGRSAQSAAIQGTVYQSPQKDKVHKSRDVQAPLVLPMAAVIANKKAEYLQRVLNYYKRPERWRTHGLRE